MLPWGTPEWMWKRLEISPLILFRIGLHLGTISAGKRKLESKILLILTSSPGCHTLSNAWLTSKNAAVNTAGVP
jgi:hypothetical protein